MTDDAARHRRLAEIKEKARRAFLDIGALRAAWRPKKGIDVSVADAVLIAVTVVCTGFAVLFFVAQGLSSHMPIFAGQDFALYREATSRWLTGGPYYLPEQLTGGPYEMRFGVVLYPPLAFVLFVPALILPSALWWAIPLAVTGFMVASLRPARWTWPLIALCLAYFPTSQLIWAGNPAMWMMAALAVATRWRPAAAFVFLKPSLAPFAFFGARDRRWWALTAGLALVSIALLPLDLQWLTAVSNARGDQSGVLYSLRDVPLLAIPLIAWLGRSAQTNGERREGIVA